MQSIQDYYKLIQEAHVKEHPEDALDFPEHDLRYSDRANGKIAKRSSASLLNVFRNRISKQVNLMVELHGRTAKPSGYDDGKYRQLLGDLFRSKHGQELTMWDEFELLREQPKWAEEMDSKKQPGSKSSKVKAKRNDLINDVLARADVERAAPSFSQAAPMVAQNDDATAALKELVATVSSLTRSQVFDLLHVVEFKFAP